MKDFIHPSFKFAVLLCMGLLVGLSALTEAAVAATTQVGRSAPAMPVVRLVPGAAQSGGLSVIPAPATLIEAQVLDLVRQMARRAARSGPADPAGSPASRWDVSLGAADARLHLAPCAKVAVYVPNGIDLWGRSRVGLRCEQGAVRWNVFVPVTVSVYAQGVVPAVNLLQGSRIEAADLRVAEVDLAAERSPAILTIDAAIGRVVAQSIQAGQSLRQGSLKPKRYFSVGDPVRLVVKGPGFSVNGEGEALTPGDDGQCARIRTDAGRIVCGRPIGDRVVELLL